MHPAQVLSVCLLALAVPAAPNPTWRVPTTTDPNTTPKYGIKEKFKEFLRKVVYGITPTTIFTTLRPNKFPEEYDPIKDLEWQFAEQNRKGITTRDYEPRLTDKTKLWDGYFNDPTFDGMTFWCNRHLHANDSRPTTVKRYWEKDWGDQRDLEAIAQHWFNEARRVNSEWHATFITTPFVPLRDLTRSGNVTWSARWDSDIETEERHAMREIQRLTDEKYERQFAPYNYNYSPRSPESTTETRYPTTPVPTGPDGKTVKPVRTPIYPGFELKSESFDISSHMFPRVPRSELERREARRKGEKPQEE